MIPGFSAAPMFMTRGTSGPSLGELFEGGYYMGDIVVGGNGYRLIFAPYDSIASNIAWNSITGSIAGAQSTIDGLSNTAAILSYGGTAPAANHCVGLSIGGYEDWYLPAIDELAVIFSNRAALPSGQELGVFGHWSSTEANATSAYGMSPSSGQYLFSKTSTSGSTTRAVRRSLIE